MRREQDVYLKGTVGVGEVIDHLKSMTSIWGQPVFEASTLSEDEWTLRLTSANELFPSSERPRVNVQAQLMTARMADWLTDAAEQHGVAVEGGGYRAVLRVENSDPHEVTLFFNVVDRLASWSRFDESIVIHEHPGFALHTAATGWLGPESNGMGLGPEVTINGERQT